MCSYTTKELIRVQEFLSKGNRALKIAGKRLADGEVILDFSGVDNLTDKQLFLLLSPIRGRVRQDNSIMGEYINISSISTNSTNVYSQISEYLYGSHDTHDPPPYRLALLVVLAIIGSFLGWKVIQFYSGVRVTVDSLTIGILTSAKDYKPLEEYLENKLIVDDYWSFIRGKRIKVIIDGDRKLKYQEARARITEKEWDIAFTFSPMIAIAAKNNKYVYAARMFPDQPPFYQSALFVRENSSIKSLNDLKPTTTMAMGEIGSASSFFMPAYDLYGKTLTVKKDNRGPDIVKMVKDGEADVGAGVFGATVKNDTKIRIIQISRNIPGSGVYISPRLVKQDRESIIKALLEAPKDIQEKANYGLGSEPDYSAFLEVVRRVEEILSCSSFDNNPVSFFCHKSAFLKTSSNSFSPLVTLIGKVNGYRVPSETIIWLNLENLDEKTYKVVITPSLLSAIPNAGNPLNLQNKKIQLNNVIPRKLTNENWEIIVNNVEQLKVLEP